MWGGGDTTVKFSKEFRESLLNRVHMHGDWLTLTSKTEESVSPGLKVLAQPSGLLSVLGFGA